jgi:glycosyltransferase involved in cell wall biosynthesis
MRLRPDVVHSWNTVPGMLGPIAARNSARLIAGYYRIERWKPMWEAWSERCLARGAKRIVTDSFTVLDWCVMRHLPAEKLVVIPPGVAIGPTSNVSRAALLNELQLPADARLIGVVGRLVPEKRVQDLIWAADLLRVLHDNDGPLRTQLEQYARMASDLDHIRFLGERDDLHRFMPHFNVVWNGSDNHSLSIALLEAMAAGVPVIASDVPVNRDLVVHGETGYLIPVGRRSGRADRARYTDNIFNDVGLAARLRAAALERARSSFSLERFVQRHIELYATLE